MKELLDYALAHADDTMETLRTMVEMESFTADKPSVDKLSFYIKERLETLRASVEVISQAETGNHLLAEWGEGDEQILILCHMDTVWATGTLQEMPFRMQDGLVSGPGILDMKAGIAILLHALDALKTLGLAPQRRVKMVFNSDEEVGSTTSRALIEEEARKSAHVFVLEPAAGSGGALKIGRKGVGMFQLKVTGRAAHAGNEPEKGISAVEELAHQIIRLHSFTDLEIGTTVNVGVMSGGSVRNQIAPFAEGLVDLRVATMSEADRVTEEILALKPSLPGAVVEITGGMNRLPMEKTPATARLLESARNISEPLGIELGEAHVGGGSDAQFASAMGVAVLDGLGGVGEGPHAVHEHIIAAELPRRVGLLASLLMGT